MKGFHPMSVSFTNKTPPLETVAGDA